jgi:predicted transcriptional regulator
VGRHPSLRQNHLRGVTVQGRARNDIAYTTVKTYLDRLIHKGYATACALGDPRSTGLYTATVFRQKVCDHPDRLERIINAFKLRPPGLVLWCYRKGKLIRKDKAELEVLLHNLPDEALPLRRERRGVIRLAHSANGAGGGRQGMCLGGRGASSIAGRRR